VVIAGNIAYADPHRLSVYPDVVSVAVAPLAVYVAGRRRRQRGESPEAVQAFGVRVGATAGAVFATGLRALYSFDPAGRLVLRVDPSELTAPVESSILVWENVGR
jgi:hypothetical protein